MAADTCAKCQDPDGSRSPLLACRTCHRKFHETCGLKSATSSSSTGRTCPTCLGILEGPVRQSHSSGLYSLPHPSLVSSFEVNGGSRSAEVSSETYSSSLGSKPMQSRFGEQCHDPGCDSRVQSGHKFCNSHQPSPEISRVISIPQARNLPQGLVRLASGHLVINTNGSPQQLVDSPPSLPANSRLGPEFAGKAGKTARKGGRDPPGTFNRLPFKRARPDASPSQDGSPLRLKQPFQMSPQRAMNGSPQAAPSPNFPLSPQNRSPRGLRLYPVNKYSPVQRLVSAQANAPKVYRGSTAGMTPSKPPPPTSANETGRGFTPSELFNLEAKAEQWHVKQGSSLQALGGSRFDINGAGVRLGAPNGATAHHSADGRKVGCAPCHQESELEERETSSDPTRYPQNLRSELSEKVSEILVKHGITKPPAPKQARQATISKINKRRKLDGVAEFRSRLFQSFDQASFDAMFYGQEDACTPPAGVVATERMDNPPPLGEDNRLYLPLDPRIHWPRNWTDEWYEAKMREIRARGGRKANFGRVVERLRDRRRDESDFSCREQAAIEADKTPPRREPQPWAHQRPIGFGDIPEGELPEDVMNDAAWREAAAWMRSTRQKTVERDRHVEKLLAQGKSIEHLLGPTGW